MSYVYFDPDEWETVVETRPCAACGGDLRKCNGACNRMTIVSQRRRSPEDIAKIKATRRREEEDEILRRAEAIRAKRDLL